VGINTCAIAMVEMNQSTRCASRTKNILTPGAAAAIGANIGMQAYNPDLGGPWWLPQTVSLVASTFLSYTRLAWR